MRKRLTILISLASLVACTKEDWSSNIQIGTKFNYTQELRWLSKNGKEPTNPFTVDSIVPKAYKGYDGYWVSSSNGMIYIMDPVIIKAGIKR